MVRVSAALTTVTAQPGQENVDRHVADQDGRGDPAQPEVGGRRVVHQARQRGLVVAAQERPRRADADGPEAPCHVVDEVHQRLRDRGAGRRTDEVVHLGGGPARVERAADRGGGEAVDRRPSPGLDVGQGREVVGELVLELVGGRHLNVADEAAVDDQGLAGDLRTLLPGVARFDRGPEVERDLEHSPTGLTRPAIPDEPRESCVRSADFAALEAGQPQESSEREVVLNEIVRLDRGAEFDSGLQGMPAAGPDPGGSQLDHPSRGRQFRNDARLH